MGERNAKGYPSRLEHWKLTSRDQVRLQAAAQSYGGKVEPWEGHEGQFSLHTETDALPILLLPGQTLSSFYELWSGGGAQRRCDGVTEMLSDGPCLCDPDKRECKPHTRLQVLLPDVPGLGCWRLDTTGYYAAVELAGTVDLLEMATGRGVLLPARLRIDQRSVLRDGQTRRFPVPTLDIDVRPLEMHALTQGEVPEEFQIAGRYPQKDGSVEVVGFDGSTTTYTPVPALPSAGVSVKEGLDAAEAQVEQKTRTARSAAPIGASEDIGGDIPIPVPDSEPEVGGSVQTSVAGPPASVKPDPGASGSDIATADQQKLLMATAREHGWSDAARYDLTANICGEGIRSVKRVPKDKVDALLEALQHPERGVGGGDGQNLDELVGKLRDYGNALGIIDQVNAAIAQHPDDREWIERQTIRLKERYEEAQGAA